MLARELATPLPAVLKMSLREAAEWAEAVRRTNTPIKGA